MSRVPRVVELVPYGIEVPDLTRIVQLTVVGIDKADHHDTPVAVIPPDGAAGVAAVDHPIGPRESTSLRTGGAGAGESAAPVLAGGRLRRKGPARLAHVGPGWQIPIPMGVVGDRGVGPIGRDSHVRLNRIGACVRHAIVGLGTSGRAGRPAWCDHLLGRHTDFTRVSESGAAFAASLRPCRIGRGYWHRVRVTSRTNLTQVLERLADLETEYEAVLARLSDPEVLSDHRVLRDLARRHKELEPVVLAYRDLRAASADLRAAREMYAESVGDERELAQGEIEASEASIARLEDELRTLLLPTDADQGKAVILEIRGAEGGEEANLFAKDLFEMYTHYAEHRGWKVELLGSDPSEKGGLNEVALMVRGPDAWTVLKHEGGTHRVQRVPATESQGRIHTSSATVTALVEAEEIDVAIDPGDLKVDVYRSTGPGGQSVNTTDSAVRITHLPSGIVVAMQDEKSQIQNRAKAMQVLRARLLRAEQDRQAAEVSAQRRSQVGGGGRSEKIRTYNFKENRVTDHRIGLTLHKLDRVLVGELDQLSEALGADERGRQLRGEA